MSARRRNVRERLDAAGAASVELVLRPERFFRWLLRFHKHSMPIVLIWIVGIATAIDNLDGRMALAGAMGRPIPAMALRWTTLWPALILGGAISGCLTWLILGWWYRVRLAFCGARNVPKRQARLVWLYSSSVAALPAVIVTALATPMHRDYQAAFAAAPLAGSLIALTFWAAFVGYRGAIACFPVKRTPALWWFFILPVSWLGLVLAVVVGATVAVAL